MAKYSANPVMAAYEAAHNGRFYGSYVTQRKRRWTCLSLDQSTMIEASSLEELVHIAPHIFKRPKQKPIKQPKQKTIKPVLKHLQGVPKELRPYTFVQGYKVRKRHNLFTCLSADKSETITCTFEELVTLPHLNFVLST